ncbi:MAG: lipid II flippase MurJ [Patescibacteria group bacterium]
MAILSFFRFEPKGVHQAALLLALSSAANGVLGLLRDRLLASSYGASRELDIYYAAFRVPDIIFTLSLFFVASTAFIPLFLERSEHDARRGEEFFGAIILIFFAVMSIMSIFAFIYMPFFVRFAVPGFRAEDQMATMMLARIMLCSPIFLGFSSLISGVSQSRKKFLAYALSPIAYNIGIIFGAVVFAPRFGITGLAWGVALGAFLHMSVQLPTLLRIGVRPRYSLASVSRSFEIIMYSFPRALALSWNQITMLFLTSIASVLGAGAISVFNFSYNLHSLPLVVIGLSYSVAAFPTMAELALKDKKQVFFEHVVSGARHILFWTMPVAALFIVMRAQIVRIILGSGSFEWLDTRLTAASLALFAIALVFQSLVTLFVRAYYALGRAREPILYNMVASFLTLAVAGSSIWLLGPDSAFKTFLESLFRLENLGHGQKIAVIEFLSIPFAYVFGSCVNAVLLGTGLFRMNGKDVWVPLTVTLRMVMIVSVAMGFAAYGALIIAGTFVSLETASGILIQGALALFVALAVGVGVCYVLRVREFLEVLDAVHARFSHRGVLQPEIEHL